MLLPCSLTKGPQGTSSPRLSGLSASQSTVTGRQRCGAAERRKHKEAIDSVSVACVTAETRGVSGVKPVWEEAEELPVCRKKQQYLFVFGEEKSQCDVLPSVSSTHSIPIMETSNY